MKLYLLYLVKGKQNYKIGDNIKNFLNDKEDFKTKKLLDWGTDFSAEIHGAYTTLQVKEGYFDFWGKYKEPRGAKGTINHNFVIVNSRGTILGIFEINISDDKIITSEN